MTKQKEFFEMLSVSRDDLRLLFEGNKKAQAKIEKMDDDAMAHFARKAGEAMMSDYWETLRVAFEERVLKED
jgi:chaperonin cofactor prefoldin